MENVFLTPEQRAQRLKDTIYALDSMDREPLSVYRPLDTVAPFHASECHERILRGGKRSGKTLSCALDFASYATGAPVILNDGTRLPVRDSHKNKKICWIIGFDQKHIGQVIFPKLFEPLHDYPLIRDLDTGKWRAYNANIPGDKEREDQCKPTSPMIPSRFIDPKGWGWESKREKIFTQCRLKDGTMIHAFPSTSPQAMQGVAADMIWIDEDIRFPEHLKEWQDRLSTKHGWLIWSVWPHSTNNALLDIHKRAEQQKNQEKRFVQEWVIKMSDNPYLTAEQIEAAIDRMASPEERRARDYGEFIFSRILMYSFNPALHGVPSTAYLDDPLTKIYVDNGRKFPHHWTRYLYLDPGYATSAALIVVAPPPQEVGNNEYIIIEDEVYLNNASCKDMAREVATKGGGVFFEAFYIDNHAARQTPMAGGPTIGQQYVEAFQSFGLECHQTGSNFLPGSDNVGARTTKVRTYLQAREDAGPKLRFVLDKTPKTQEEFGKYKRIVTKEDYTDRPVDAHNHAMNCLEYCVMSEPEFVPGNAEMSVMPANVRAFWEFYNQRMAHAPKGSKSVNLGPPNPSQ